VTFAGWTGGGRDERSRLLHRRRARGSSSLCARRELVGTVMRVEWSVKCVW